MRQLKFTGIPKIESQFGGEKLDGKRKGRRPLSTSRPLHLVIKSEKIEKSISFTRYNNEIQRLVTNTTQRFGIKIHSRSLNFNHLHLVMSFGHRTQYVSFVRVMNAAIVRLLETKTGKKLKGLFTLRPFTRIVTWGRDFIGLLKYLRINQYESCGVDLSGRYEIKT